jgi:hypothetical protein
MVTEREKEQKRSPESCCFSPSQGPTGLVDDDGGALMPCPSVTCGCRTGDVRPAKTGGASLRRVLRLDPQRGGRLGLAVLAYLLRRSNHHTSLPTLTPGVYPPAWPVVSWGPWAPRPMADVPDSSPLGLGEANMADPSSLGSGEADVPDPLPFGSGKAAVSFSRALCWAIDAPSPCGLCCGRLTFQLAQAEYFEGANP